MKALVIAVWIGPLPGWFALWLRSAAGNPALRFLLLTDQHVAGPLPANVNIAATDLATLSDTFSARLGFSVALDQPYKLCDFKPLYWMLAPRLDDCDYWGFCDLDVIWGDLSPLLARTLGPFDAVLGEGHLRLFRNDEPCRELYRHPAVPFDWRAALSSPMIMGLDEHPGINHALAGGGFRWFADPQAVADIDADFRQFRLVPQADNPRLQAFRWEDGRVWRDSWRGGAARSEEFLYIHFQKRALRTDPAALDAAAVAIDPGGIAARPAGPVTPSELARRNPWRWPNALEARILLRERWRRLRGAPLPFPATGSLAALPPK